MIYFYIFIGIYLVSILLSKYYDWILYEHSNIPYQENKECYTPFLNTFMVLIFTVYFIILYFKNRKNGSM
jgi:hypothetical protein